MNKIKTTLGNFLVLGILFIILIQIIEVVPKVFNSVYDYVEGLNLSEDIVLIIMATIVLFVISVTNANAGHDILDEIERMVTKKKKDDNE